MKIGDQVILNYKWHEICTAQNKIYKQKGLAQCDHKNMEDVPLNMLLEIRDIHKDGDIWIRHKQARGCMHKECFILIKKGDTLND